jgi:uncharacterized protein (DUF2147 family)
MKRIVTGLVTIAAGTLLSTAAMAASLNGSQWQTVDEKTGEKKAIVQISESNGQVSGKIIKVMNAADAKEKCTKCSGSLKDKPIEGLNFLYGMKADGTNEWSGGKLVDPESGKVYSGKITLSDNGQSLKLRGYVGSPVFGRSQTWKRIK